jgi:hypothetical protein
MVRRLSLPTCRGALPIVALVLALGQTPAVAQDAAPSPAPLRVTVDGGAVAVTGPSGYCIDRAASRADAAGAFLLLGSCAALGGGRARPETGPAMLTATVANRSSGAGIGPEGFDELIAFFGSEPGRAALSRTGRAETVRLVSAEKRGRAVYLQIEDSAAAPGQTIAPVYWRAIVALRGRMVTLSALSNSAAPVSPGDLRNVLEAFVDRMTAANPGQG